MTKTTTYLLLMLITILVGTFFYMTCCSSCRLPIKETPKVEKVIAPVTTQKASSYPFAFSSGTYAYNENDNYNFNTSSSEFLTPLSEKVSDGVGSLKNFLSENSKKAITIIGYYKADEENNSAYPNLGLARANAVKNDFVAKGIPSAQINTTGKLVDDMVPKDNVYYGPVAYNIEDMPDTDADDLKALYNKIKENPLVLYFENAKTSLNLTAEQRQKVADISRYLDKSETAKVNIIGHTDDTGNAASNMRLGLKRANFAKTYFINNGISESKINTSSKGQKQPIESNATESGRAKNRRTVVTLN